MVSPLNCATSAAGCILASAGLVSVVFSAGYLEYVGAVIGGRCKAQAAFVFVGVPCFARDSVKNNFIPCAYRRAGAGVLSGVFGDHFCLHGFPFMRFEVG
jgi:hypothetical protein